MIDLIISEAGEKMDKSVGALKKDLQKVRTGRASLNLFDDVRVDYYNTPTPLNQIASLSVPESRLITIQPWDPSAIKEIEKAYRVRYRMPISRLARTTVRTVSVPRSWPLIRLSIRFLAHRPLPSMITATCCGSREGSSPVFSSESDFKDFLFLVPEHLVYLFDMLVCELLHLVKGLGHVIFRSVAVFFERF